MTVTTPQTGLRNATLPDLVALLRDQEARKVDLVVPAEKIRFERGVLVLPDTEIELSDTGVGRADGRYVPTQVFDDGLAGKLDIPGSYLRWLRGNRLDLFDKNLNGLLHGSEPEIFIDGDDLGEIPGVPADARSFLLRLFRGEDGTGVARSFHSDRYFRIDNFDVLTAVLSGVRDSGIRTEIPRCDLTDRRMYVKVTAPEVTALAPELLKNYRSPFGGGRGIDNPVVWAGFVVTNSETGGGAATITPSFEIKVCTNGMTVTKDAMRAVHLGGRQDEGVVRWSADTQRKTLNVITAKAKDAVNTFLDVDYMTRVIREVEEKAGARVSKPAEAIQEIGKALAFDQGTIDGVLDHFIQGGDTTAGGVMQAVTSFAQTIANADTAFEVESAGLRALELAAARR